MSHGRLARLRLFLLQYCSFLVGSGVVTLTYRILLEQSENRKLTCGTSKVILLLDVLYTNLVSSLKSLVVVWK